VYLKKLGEYPRENKMKQKFTFDIDEKKEIITIQEACEVDPGAFVTVHQEQYPYIDMKNAVEEGEEPFVEIFRRKNLFPPQDLSLKLFEHLENYFKEGGAEKEGDADKFVVDYEDVEAFPQEDEGPEEVDDADVEELESLLQDDTEDITEDDIKEIDGEDDTPKFQPDNNSEDEN